MQPIPYCFCVSTHVASRNHREMSQYKTISDMIREAGIPDLRFDEILTQLSKLKQGLDEGREKIPEK
jgi:hypothetical protein